MSAAQPEARSNSVTCRWPIRTIEQSPSVRCPSAQCSQSRRRLADSMAVWFCTRPGWTRNHLSMAAVFPLVLIVLFFARPFKLTRGELIVIFCGPLIGSTMPTYFLAKIVGNFAVPHYLASPENQWAAHFDPHLPSYLGCAQGRSAALVLRRHASGRVYPVGCLDRPGVSGGARSSSLYTVSVFA